MNLNKKNIKQIMGLIIFAGLVLWMVFNYTIFASLIKFIINLIMPIIVGIAISFILNVPMKQIEKNIFNINKRKHKKLIRVISLILSILLIFGIIILIMFLIIPDKLLSIFADNGDTATYLSMVGSPCLRIISSSFLIAAFCIVFMSMFQALGNGFASMCVSVIRQLVILLPSACLLSLTENLNLVWLSFLIAEVVAFSISLCLFIKMYRGKIKPLEQVREINNG